LLISPTDAAKNLTWGAFSFNDFFKTVLYKAHPGWKRAVSQSNASIRYSMGGGGIKRLSSTSQFKLSE
jgi:hypothetical protein